jgi:putative nucleotidyltransferase with HDIG domain
MPKSLAIYIAGVVAASAVALVVTTLAFPVRPEIALSLTGGSAQPTQAETAAGVAYWTLIALLASALPVRLPYGSAIDVATAPILASMTLGGPTAAAWVAVLGTTELRELRGRLPWYGTLANHAGAVLPAVAGAVAQQLVRGGSTELAIGFVSALLGGAIFFVCNAALASTLVALRTGQPIRTVVAGDLRDVAVSALALAPLAWAMAQMYLIAWWASLILTVPLYTTRLAYHRIVELREMFTHTISSLAAAVDKRDPYTADHSRRVSEIALGIGLEMRLSAAQMEALEWGGLLHDVGKIGVRDDVLLKQDKLTREERIKMNAHPVLGAEIIAPVTRLAPELPIIRHHHEWYNGSGYPDRLMGEEIPLLARILHVADAFEAMTAPRPYRPTPLSNEQAIAELRKFAGVQFDPGVVDAFVRTSWASDTPDPGREIVVKPIPMISQVTDAGRTMSAAGTPAASQAVETPAP